MKKDQAKRKDWPGVSYLEALCPEPGWHTEFALLCSYSIDMVVMGAALLALSGLDDDRGTGSPVDIVKSFKNTAGRVGVIVQSGRILASVKSPKIVSIMDRYLREFKADEKESSWHPKAALVKHVSDDDKDTQWHLWIGSRNLTKHLSWDTGLVLFGEKGGKGIRINGIPELGYRLAKQAGLSKAKPNKVRADLEKVKWELPRGCMDIESIRLYMPGDKRKLPSVPKGLKRLIVTSPFLDSYTLNELGKWGEEATERVLVSSRMELARLSQSGQRGLAGFKLRSLDAPIPDDEALEQSREKDVEKSEDEEPDFRGLHAKLIYAETDRKRLLWLGSANATKRGWERNGEIIAALEVGKSGAEGLDDFINNIARICRPEDLAKPYDPDPDEESLEEARKQVVGRWNVEQRQSPDGPLLKNGKRIDPNPDDKRIAMKVGLFECPSVPWPRGASSVTLPAAKNAEATELVRIRLSLGKKAISWLQIAKMNPPPDEGRDQEAIGGYLNVRTYMLWIKSMLTGASDDVESGDWKIPEKSLRELRGKKNTPGWWAPTLEDILRACVRNSKELVSIDASVRHFKKIWSGKIKDEDRKIIEDFEKTWQVLRTELIPEA